MQCVVFEAWESVWWLCTMYAWCEMDAWMLGGEKMNEYDQLDDDWLDEHDQLDGYD